MYLFCDLVEFDTILNGTTAQKNGGEQYNIWEESHWSYWGQSYDLSASCCSNDDDDHIYKMTVQSQKFSCRFFEETVIGKKLQYNFPNDGEGQGGKGIFGKFLSSFIFKTHNAILFAGLYLVCKIIEHLNMFWNVMKGQFAPLTFLLQPLLDKSFPWLGGNPVCRWWEIWQGK